MILAKDMIKYRHSLGSDSDSNSQLLYNIAGGSWYGGTDVPTGSQTHTAAKGLFNLGQELELDPTSINSRDENGKTPLHWACQGNNPAVVKLLLREGADSNVADFIGQTPLMAAARRGASACAEFLLLPPSCKVDKLDAQGRSALHYAAASPYDEGYQVMRLLLDRGADPKRRNQGGEEPLHELASCYTSALSMDEVGQRIVLLARFGAPLESRDAWGYTPALQAAAENNRKALAMLLALGTAVDVVDGDQQGLLHLAALYGGSGMFKQLKSMKTVLAGFIDPHAVDYQGDTPAALFDWRRHASLGGCGSWTTTPTPEDVILFEDLRRMLQGKTTVVVEARSPLATATR